MSINQAAGIGANIRLTNCIATSHDPSSDVIGIAEFLSFSCGRDGDGQANVVTVQNINVVAEIYPYHFISHRFNCIIENNCDIPDIATQY